MHIDQPLDYHKFEICQIVSKSLRLLDVQSIRTNVQHSLTIADFRAASIFLKKLKLVINTYKRRDQNLSRI